MIVVRLSDGSLWVNSPVPLPLASIEEIVSLGPVRYLVAPTAPHVWRLEQWASLFPDAQLWGPPRSLLRHPRMPFTGMLSETPPPAWSDDLDQLIFCGNLVVEEAEFFHRSSRTVILADVVQNYQAEPGDAAGTIVKAIGGVLGGGVPRDIRLTTRKDVARRSLDRLLAWDFEKLIVAHGACVEHDAKAFVERAFRWLRP